MELMVDRVDPATLQTAAGLPSIKSMNESLVFEAHEKNRLRELAKRVAGIAALPVQAEKAKLWEKHNGLKTSQPLVFIDPENGWNECIPADTLSCRTPMARVWEMFLRKQIYWFEVFKDDKVIEPYFDVPHSYSDTGWGVKLDKLGGEKGGAYKVVQAIKDYGEDFPMLHYPKIIIDWEESDKVLELAHDLFDDILTVRRKSIWWWSLGLTWEFINLRGLEDFLCDMIDWPEYVHKLMNLLCEGALNKLDILQKNGFLALNTGGTYVGSGGFGFSHELPGPEHDPQKITTMDMWGFVESQETSSVSPEMYNEFIFPYHKRIAERFGLNCYGCCEGFDLRWKYVKNLPRLRRISVSPWAKWETVGELLGKDYIASIKPNPSYLASAKMDEETVRGDIRKALECSRNGVPELIMKDNNTLGRNPRNAARWVEIAREEIEKS